MHPSKKLFWVVAAAAVAVLAYLAFGQVAGTSTVFVQNASSEGEETTTTLEEGTTSTTETDPGITYIDPETGEQVTITDRSQLPEGVTIVPTDQVTTTTVTPASPSVSEGEPPAGEPDPEVTTTTEAPPPPTTTTTLPQKFDHRVQVLIEGDVNIRTHIDLICENGDQWSWSASGGQVLDTQTWQRTEQYFNCFVQAIPQGHHIDFVSDDIEQVTVIL